MFFRMRPGPYKPQYSCPFHTSTANSLIVFMQKYNSCLEQRMLAHIDAQQNEGYIATMAQQIASIMWHKQLRSSKIMINLAYHDGDALSTGDIN